ncbi:DUF1275 family protein [Pseudomonas sp. PCH446]
MDTPLHPSVGPALSFNGGFVDTLGFLALQGLFTAHVTGNFVTLGVSIVHGTSGALPKLIALPVFVLVVGLTHLAAVAIHRRGLAPLRLLLVTHTLLLAAFALLAILWGPFTDGDSATALITGMTGVTAMAIQNAISRQHMKGTPPTTLMTGNVTQFAVDVFALWTERDIEQRTIIKQRLNRFARHCWPLPQAASAPPCSILPGLMGADPAGGGRRGRLPGCPPRRPAQGLGAATRFLPASKGQDQ